MLGGLSISVREAPIRVLALTRFLGISLIFWVAIAALAVAWLIQNHTLLGRRVFALGGGEDIAALSGISIPIMKIAIFAMAGAFTGLAAVLAVAQIGQGSPRMADGRLFITTTAVVAGGTALTGGYGSVLNSLIGVLIVTVLANGMVLLGVSPLLQQGVYGIMIIIAVASSLDRNVLKIVK
jgi:ribose transport system permease protein